MSEQLNEAINAIKSGNKETGYRILKEIIQKDPGGKGAETAWLWMSAVVDDPRQKQKCLETVLVLNPNNTAARKRLAKLAAKSFSTETPSSGRPVDEPTRTSPEPTAEDPIQESPPRSFEETTLPPDEQAMASTTAWFHNLSEGQITFRPYQWLGIGGCVLLAIGVFVPLLRLPIVGGINYFQNGQGDGIFILILALISLILLLLGKFKWLWLTGFASLGIIGFTLVGLIRLIAELQSTVQDELADNIFGGLVSLLVESVQIEWGWVLLIGGVSLLLGSAALLRGSIFPWKHFAAGFILFVLLFAVLSIFRDQTFDTAESAASDTQDQRPSGSATSGRSEPEIIPLGQPVVYEEGRLSILQVHKPTGFHVVESMSMSHEGVEPIPGITYAAVEIEFTCTTVDDVLCELVPEATLKLILEDGREVEDDDYRLYDVPRLGSEDVAIRRTTRGWRVFQVPEEATLRWLEVDPFDGSPLRAELPKPVDGYTAIQPWVDDESGGYQIVPGLRRELRKLRMDPSMVAHVETDENRAMFVEICEDISVYFDEDEAYDDYQQLVMNVVASTKGYRNSGEGLLIVINDCSSFSVSKLQVLFLGTTLDSWERGGLSNYQLLDQGYPSLD